MASQMSPFCEEKRLHIPFLLCIFFYKLPRVTTGYHGLPRVTTGYRYLPSYPHGFWCFPIWLTTTLSYPKAIFSANEIWNFYKSVCYCGISNKTFSQVTFISKSVCYCVIPNETFFLVVKSTRMFFFLRVSATVAF